MKPISEINKNYTNQQIHNYYLNGDDVFLERFFVKQINHRFINGEGSKILYHFNVDQEQDFLNDLKSNSLFDSKKNRLGYGKGFYDKYLNKYLRRYKKILTIGVAFSFQKHHRLPINRNDVKLDFIITEKGIY